MKRIAAIIIVIGLVATSCSKNVESTPLVTDAKTSEAGEKPKGIPALTVQITLNRQALGQPLFYGSDVQYSEVRDPKLDVYLQSLAVGHIPATFRIAGKELQLVADQRRLFPSDVNHPERVLARYPVIAENAETITVESSRAGAYLNEIIAEKKESLPKDSWVRSFEFAAQDNLMLQETSIQLADGNVVDLLESVMPQSNLKAGPDFTAISLSAADKKGSLDKGDLPSRFMMLKSEKIRQGEDEVAFAQHYDLSNGKTIDWYVTPNAPAKFMDAIRAGVEGWNRYFRKMKGIERNVLQFKGAMPAGMKLGDPRYNIINWDSRLVAGAAYESQASDPFTGKQSHSLIYLPAAWVEIGKKYWAGGQYSERAEKSGSVSAKALAQSSLSSKLFKVACLREVESAAGLLYSGAIDKTSVEDFGIELLKAVLLHEIGHALGLGHNFKGSLSYDSQSPETFSTSIMDYNAYNLEKAVFDSLTSSDGPLLAYDRQALSALYNRAQDITAEEEKSPLPACNDELADNEEGGVDPLCTRYDIESDPSRSIETALALLDQETIAGRVTMTQAMRRVIAETLSVEIGNKIVDQASALALTKKLANGLMAAIRFYLLQDTASLSRTVRTNIKTLYIFEKDVLPKAYKADEMRERVFKGVERVMGMIDLPTQMQKVIDEGREQLKALIIASPWVSAVGDIDRSGGHLDEDEANVLLDLALKDYQESWVAFKKDANSGLARIRLAVVAELVRKPAASFFLGKVGPKDSQKLVDFETSIVGLVAEAVGNKDQRLPLERLTAAKTLMSFKGRKSAEAAIKGAIDKIELERATADTTENRDAAEALIKLLSPEVKKETEEEKK